MSPLVTGVPYLGSRTGRLGVALALALALLLPSAARASAPGVHLLPSMEGQTPAAESARSPLLKPGPMLLLVGGGAALVSVPASLFLGSFVGSLSNNLILAAVPGLLLFALIPPLAVTWAEWLYANMEVPGSVKFQPAVWVALGLHVAAMVGAIAFGVSTQNLLSVAILTVIEAFLLPGAVTLMIRLGNERAAAIAAGQPPPVYYSDPFPGRTLDLPRVPIIPLAAFSF